jgi:hypothetical protein
MLRLWPRGEILSSDHEIDPSNVSETEIAMQNEVTQMTVQSTTSAAITIRTMDSSERDRRALARLAELDTREPLAGRVLGLEIDGAVVAAVEVDSGRILADPFSRTEEHRAILELRAKQLRHRHRGRHRRARGIGSRSRPALGGSPPGQIISLPRVS